MSLYYDCRERKWRETEAEAQKHWRELQKKLALAREEKMKQNMKIRLEWEREEKRLKELKKAKVMFKEWFNLNYNV